MDGLILMLESSPELLEALVKFVNPALLMLIPILWFIGIKLKESKKVLDWKITFILLAISLLLCISFILISSGVTAMSLWIGIMQGLAIWALEGQLYQSYKQVKINRKIDENKV